MATARSRDSFELLSRMERTKRLLRISFQLDARGGRAGAARLSRGHGPGGQPGRRVQVTPLAAGRTLASSCRACSREQISVASDLEHDPGKQWGRPVVGWALHRLGVLGNRHGQQHQRPAAEPGRRSAVPERATTRQHQRQHRHRSVVLGRRVELHRPTCRQPDHHLHGILAMGLRRIAIVLVAGGLATSCARSSPTDGR